MSRLARLALVLLTAAALSGEENLNKAKGFNAASTYDFSSVEAVNAFNGSITLNVPLGQTYAVGPVLKYSFGLVYTGNNWETNENTWQVWAAVPPSNPRDPDDPVEFAWQTRSSTYNEPLDRGAIDGKLSLSAGLGWRVTLGQLRGDGSSYVYTAPDGSSHGFSDGLGTEAAVGAADNTFYTNDSSYLRLRKQSDGSVQIDFPDGTVQTFDTEGRLTEIRDGLPRTAAGTYPNWVRYAYGPRVGEYTVITITDSIGRQHELTFRRMSGVGGIDQDNEFPYGNLGTTEDPDAYDVLVEASVAAFGTTTPATYELEYLDADNNTATFEAVPISRKYTLRQDCSVPSAVHVPLLSVVNQPEGQSYTVTYDRGNTISFSNPDPIGTTEELAGISGVVIQEGGSGYGSSATVTFSGGGGSGGGTGTPVIGIGGAITGIQINNPGSYTFAPTVTINGNGSGSGARAIAAVCAQVHAFSGNPTSLRLPTGGSIDWQYRLWTFASGSAARHCDIGNGACMKAATESEGVATRLQRDAGAARTVLSKRTYSSEFQGTGDLSFHTQVTTVKDYTGFNVNDGSEGTVASTVLNYFSAGTETSKGPTGTFPGEYGLPFTRSASFGARSLAQDPLPSPGRPTRFLSTETFAGPEGAEVLKQSTYVTYESDNPAGTDLPCCNRRRRDESTLHAEDGSYVATLRDDFNGLGSYGKTTKTGNVGTAQSKVTSTTYTMSATLPYDPASPAAVWATSLFDLISTTENGRTTRTEYHFTPPSLLNRKRLLRDISTTTPARQGTDVIVAYTYDDHGYLQSETYHGGDPQPGHTPVGIGNLSSTSLGTADYTITHTRTPVDTANRQWVEQSKYSNLLTIRNVVIDLNTGLEKRSFDPADIQTDFDYDRMGRLESVKPAGRAWTTYTYPTASSSLLQVRQYPNGTTSGTPLTHSSYRFDGLGRVVSESRLIPTNVTATRYTTYDALGRRATTSDFSTDPSPPVTEYGYDALGRLTSTTTPDGSIVTFTPVGIKQTTRTARIATCTDTAPANCHPETSSWKSGTAVSTIETFDAFGRLSEVTEPGGTKTTYGYDVNDRLVSVSMAGGGTPQPRSFVYDGRGFLESETHPESGQTTYLYDARGHVIQRTSPTATVTFAYDAAERPVSVSHGNQLLKQFTYGTSTTDKSAGKLKEAIRHNPGTLEGDVTVTETYHYNGDSAGRLSSKSTTLGTQTFTDQYTYDALDAVKTVTYPACSGCGTLAAPSRTVTSRYNNGFLTGVDKYTWPGQAITYFASGMVNEVKHLNAGQLSGGPVDTYAVDASGMARPSSITFSGFCNDFTLQELASVSVVANSPANLTATVSGAASTFQWFEVLANGTETLLSGQATSTLTVTIGSTPQRFFVRAGNGTCTIDSNVATVTPNACPAPDTTVTMLSTLTRGGSAQASVPQAAQGATYVWTITGGSITSGANTRTVQFVVDCDAVTVQASVSVTPACSSTPQAGSKSASTTARTTVILSASSTAIPQGSSKDITVALTGTAPWNVTWSDGPSWSGSSPTFIRTVTPTATTTYTATPTDANGCTASHSITVTVTPPTPVNVVATATSASQVQLSWTMPGLADAFEVERRAPGEAFVLHHTTATATISVTLSATPDTAYLYRVRAVKAGTRSAPSNADLATTIVFSGTLTSGGSVLSALHVTQLRTAVNAVRALWSSGLAPAVFTDPSLPNVVAKAVHITELRAVLNEARAGLALPAVVYSTTGPVAGQVITAAEINDLRAGVR